MTLTHGHLALNMDVNCIVDDTVNNSLGFRIVLLIAGRKTLIPVFRAILTAENSGQSCCTEFLTAVAPNFHDFQQIGCLFFGQFPNQKLIKNKEIQLFVGTYDFAVTSIQTTQRERFQQFLHADITNLLESPACSIPKGTGDISLSISGIAMENNVVSLIHKRAGSQLLHLRLVQLAIRVILNVFYLMNFSRVCTINSYDEC